MKDTSKCSHFMEWSEYGEWYRDCKLGLMLEDEGDSHKVGCPVDCKGFTDTPDQLKILWKIDDALELPLAIIEDNEEGMEVVTIGFDGSKRDEASDSQKKLSEHIVELHNDFVKRL